jgi:hypothetical protein
MPTYGYCRVHAILRRASAAAGSPPAPNHKRVWRVMRDNGLLLQRHACYAVDDRPWEGLTKPRWFTSMPRIDADDTCESISSGSTECSRSTATVAMTN